MRFLRVVLTRTIANKRNAVPKEGHPHPSIFIILANYYDIGGCVDGRRNKLKRIGKIESMEKDYLIF